ncbi:MAG: hypothetical protein KME64_22830 [Scytonematopsis contorta HA4267-MV1]|jgi:uncharacterized membrane protein (UPF0136 family)|nr:hypothetical protein [Scytonematopsis contorta HA4267-MV1]
MTFSTIAVLVYGILALVGGIIGYQNAGSKMSLISGTITGLLLILASVILFQGQAWGFTLGLAVTGLLVVVFAIRLVKTRKFMPAGLMSIFGLVTLAVMLTTN